MNEIKKVAATSARLREAMDLAGKKQADLMRETGLDRGAISSYLSGKYEPKQKAIGLLARALNVSEMWLWGYDVPSVRTPSQKKADRMVPVINQLRQDDELLAMVEKLTKISSERKAIIKQLLDTFPEE